MGSTFAIASIIGPVLAGALTEHVTWRWCFYINVSFTFTDSSPFQSCRYFRFVTDIISLKLPVGGAGAVIFFLLVHLKRARTESASLREKMQSMDLLGFVLLASSITMLLLALNWGGGTHAWSSSVVIGLFVGAGLVLALFIPWQLHRKDDALIPPRLFRVNRNPALICGAAFFVNGPFQIIIYWLPIWFQAVLRSSPTQSGINYFPTVIADVLAAFIGSGIVMQLGWWNPFLLFAEAMVCIGGGLLSSIWPDISGAHWIGYQVFGGIGYSLASNLVSNPNFFAPVSYELWQREFTNFCPNSPTSLCSPRCHKIWCQSVHQHCWPLFLSAVQYLWQLELLFLSLGSG